MPQMAPMLWFYLYFFFLFTFIIFVSLNYFFKPFEKINFKISFSHITPQFFWKL
ncbi:ATP synthase F0 subunit 8 (mitochondrion) [Scylla paramamosain]|uniref:ATP synthase complex subunit 8 n=1 Tax=Scylla paramamosain TaxID=85552 RepID=C1KGZ3_SCYPA|nr:ATP synthase F0 subunit 8 [Scylla paramamosain]ACO07219.1 ATP synthase F0 subunit 8 [Scylla paramamosain]AFR34050.1 ATP synthase F0 subunit 8 [Scylla paramamosain]AVF96902.1 ATP synthase F0 subunit 8 [Scylla paramamosain]